LDLQISKRFLASAGSDSWAAPQTSVLGGLVDERQSPEKEISFSGKRPIWCFRI
jgi:hypothetical protein